MRTPVYRDLTRRRISEMWFIHNSKSRQGSHDVQESRGRSQRKQPPSVAAGWLCLCKFHTLHLRAFLDKQYTAPFKMCNDGLVSNIFSTLSTGRHAC